MNRYAWPDSPELQRLAATIEAVQADQQRFFALLGSATYNDAAEQIAEHYSLHLRDAYDLLKEPLVHLLPHRAGTDRPAPSTGPPRAGNTPAANARMGRTQ